MASRPSPWSRLKDAALRRLLDALRAAVDELAPGAAKPSVVAEKQWGVLTVSGGGSRRLPGLKLDRRAHEIRAATDGAWLQLTYRIDGRLVDSATWTAPRPDRLEEPTAFFRKHLPRVWWKAGGPPAGGKPPPRPATGTAASPRNSAAPRARSRHRKP